MGYTSGPFIPGVLTDGGFAFYGYKMCWVRWTMELHFPQKSLLGRESGLHVCPVAFILADAGRWVVIRLCQSGVCLNTRSSCSNPIMEGGRREGEKVVTCIFLEVGSI